MYVCVCVCVYMRGEGNVFANHLRASLVAVYKAKLKKLKCTLS